MGRPAGAQCLRGNFPSIKRGTFLHPGLSRSRWPRCSGAGGGRSGCRNLGRPVWALGRHWLLCGDATPMPVKLNDDLKSIVSCDGGCSADRWSAQSLRRSIGSPRRSSPSSSRRFKGVQLNEHLKTGVPWSSQATPRRRSGRSGREAPRQDPHTTNHLGRTYPQELRLEIFFAAR
jgi:hypothetical protein